MQFLGQILPQTVALTPDNQAIIEPGIANISYNSLFDSVQNLSHLLSDQGLGKGDLIGIWLRKSIPAVISLLGVVDSKAAYLPLDADGAFHRNLQIILNAKPRAIVCSMGLAEQIQASGEIICDSVNLDQADLVLVLINWTKPLVYHPDLALIFYTSGSTGIPKGVQITNQNALSFINWCLESFDLKPGETCTSLAPFHFDLSLFDLFVSWSKGMCILLVDQKSARNPLLLAKWLEDYRVNVIYSTPSLLSFILQHGRLHKYNHSEIRLVLFAGEVFPIDPLRELSQKWEKATFFNLYGPTESNVISWYAIPKLIKESQKEPFPIGKACFHANCKVLKKDQFLDIKPGIEGELIISGPSVSPGYLNDPIKNKSAYITNPSDTTHYYRTGDKVGVDKNGDLVFAGRMDRMLKRHGYRIEPAELESILLLHPGISGAAVLMVESKMIAFILKKESITEFDPLEIRQFVMDHLPAYFVPDRFVLLDEFPQTSSHKIDFQSLKENL